MIEGFYWKESKNVYQKAYDATDNFFEDLYHHIYDDTTNISSIDYGNLIYREGQNGYALDIMEAIKNKQILLIQAGVGIGKSFGYLLPIFNTYQNVEQFNKIVISTSSITLQQQLLIDIQRISNMLGIPVKADIAKGINNYACLRKIDYRIRSRNTSIAQRNVLENIVKKMEELQSSDREDLQIINEQIWKAVQLQSRGYCSNCTYSKLCPFYKKQQNISQSNIIITNHANLVRNVLDSGSMVQNVDMFVFDEAHKLEENMRNIRQGELQLNIIEWLIDRVVGVIQTNYQNGIVFSNSDELDDCCHYSHILKENIAGLFSSIRRSSSTNFSKMNTNHHSIVDCNRLMFHYNGKIINYLQNILSGFEVLFLEIEDYERQTGWTIQTKELKTLKQVSSLFQDMAKGDQSQNIYWASFFKENKINLCYAPKSNLNISKSIFSKNIPVICTSGTLLDNKDSYRYFQEGIGLEGFKNRTIVHGESYLSPFDYEHNTLFYYNPKMASPNNYDNYVLDLAVQIERLIRATNGKSLILFTSKKCLNDVYGLLTTEDFPFRILKQTDTNMQEVRDEFERDVDSCLLATGAFWEGVDIKGSSLSNLIITHLPFDVVDAVTQYRASKYVTKEEQFQEVYIPSMLVKFEQAVGRLIRSDRDTGIVSCLDSRFVNYKDLIQNRLNITNYTTNMKEVEEFSEEKILKRNQKTYSKILKP